MHTGHLKKYFWLLLNLCLAALLVLGVFFVMPAVKRYHDSVYPSRTMSVTSEGKTMVTPDIAYVSFSVVSYGKNAQDLADSNNQKMKGVIDNIKSQGLEEKDIKTSSYNLSPEYRYDQNAERRYIVGYSMTQTVSVKIRDLAKVATIVGGVTPLGVNQVGGVSFDVEDKDAALASARAEAVAKARTKAEQMAEASGLRLRGIVGVSEYQNPMPYRDDYGMGGMETMKSLAAPMPAIEAGSQEITVNVTLTYAI